MELLNGDTIRHALNLVLKHTIVVPGGDNSKIIMNKIKELAQELNILDQVCGVVDIELIKSVSISPSNLHFLINKYTVCIKKPSNKYTYIYDFDSKTLLDQDSNPFDPYSIESLRNRNNLTRIDKLSIHIYNVCVYYQNQFRKQPTREFYDKLTGKFNISANFINQYFNMPCPLVDIIPTNRQKPKSENWKVGISVDGLYNIETDEELTGWKAELVKLTTTNTIEWVKINQTPVYNEMLVFHRTSRSLAHDSHYWVHSNLWDMSKYIVGFFKSKEFEGIVSRENITAYQTTFGSYTQFGKKQNPNFSNTINIGDVCVRCPCLQDGIYMCNHLFNLSDPETFSLFSKVFLNYTFKEDLNDLGEQIPNPIDTMFAYINAKLHPEKSLNMRINSKCPSCRTYNTSSEAMININGDNPILKHPSEITCVECFLEYCSDCLQTHPGRICRGFVEDSDCDPEVQLCPACGHTTNRIDGCTCITCQIPNCGKTWCWICRCLRHPEQHVDNIDPELNHYCMTLNRYMSNPQWEDNTQFVPYEENAPIGRDPRLNFVPA